MSFLYEYHGRKPSYDSASKMANKARLDGHEQITLIWGENWIELELFSNGWVGTGWFKDVSGDDIAKDMNHNMGIRPLFRVP